VVGFLFKKSGTILPCNGRPRRRGLDVLYIDVTLKRDEEIYLMLSSDRHHDHPAQRSELEIRHLELARERNAIILDLGDFCDAMQGKGDPRASYSGLAHQYKRNDYFDSLVSRAVERYAPYAGNFAMLAMGNHEQSVLQHYGTSLTDRIAAALRERGSQCASMPYAGWVRLPSTPASRVSARSRFATRMGAAQAQ